MPAESRSQPGPEPGALPEPGARHARHGQRPRRHPIAAPRGDARPVPAGPTCTTVVLPRGMSMVPLSVARQRSWPPWQGQGSVPGHASSSTRGMWCPEE